MNHYNIRIDEYDLQHDRTRSFPSPRCGAVHQDL